MKRRPRNGAMLLELLVSILILSGVMATIAAMALQVSSRSVRIAGDSYRNAILVREVNRVQTLPYSALTVGTATTTETAQPYPHTRSVIITEPSTGVRKIRLIITPARTGYRTDSATIIRRKATSTTFDTQNG